MLYTIASFRFNALQIVPIAHALIVHNMHSGILVLDETGSIVEINPFARDVIGHVIVLVDITDRKNVEMELERLAQTDALTGVTNRRHFFELAETQFAHAQRYHHRLAILLLDVDHFKQVNERYGHLAGDSILQMVATECQRHLRSSDLFARYGGEEFICLLLEQSQEGALETAERIRQLVEQTTVEFEDQSICVTASIGVALLQQETWMILERLINQADQALYQSKANGRNRVSLWQDI